MKKYLLLLVVLITTLLSSQVVKAEEVNYKEVSYNIEEVETTKLRQSDIQPIQLTEEEVKDQIIPTIEYSTRTVINEFLPFKSTASWSVPTGYNGPSYTSDNIAEYGGYYYTAYDAYIYKSSKSNLSYSKITLPSTAIPKTSLHLYKDSLYYIDASNFLQEYNLKTNTLTKHNFELTSRYASTNYSIDMIFYNSEVYISLRKAQESFSCITLLKFNLTTQNTYLITLPDYSGDYSHVLLSPNYGGDFFVMLPSIEGQKVSDLFFLDFSSGSLVIYNNKIKPGLASGYNIIPFELESWGTNSYTANMQLFDKGILLTNCKSVNSGNSMSYFLYYDTLKYYPITLPILNANLAFIGDYNTFPKLVSTALKDGIIREIIDCTFVSISDINNIHEFYPTIYKSINTVNSELHYGYNTIQSGGARVSTMLPKFTDRNQNKWYFITQGRDNTFITSRTVDVTDEDCFVLIDKRELYKTTVTGKVKNQWGNPVSSVTINHNNGVTTTDVNGNFTLISNYASDDSTINVSRNGYTSYTSLVSNLTDTSLNNILLNKKFYTVSGTIVDEKGNKVTNSDVTIQGVKGKTDNNGLFSIDISIN